MTSPPSYPYVLNHEFLSNGDVRVTFAVGYLRRTTVTMPYMRWLEGESVMVGRLATEFAAATSTPRRSVSDSQAL